MSGIGFGPAERPVLSARAAGVALDDRPPARSTVQISGLPSGALVEIEAVAHV